jgi:hypothetical protein
MTLIDIVRKKNERYSKLKYKFFFAVTIRALLDSHVGKLQFATYYAWSVVGFQIRKI